MSFKKIVLVAFVFGLAAGCSKGSIPANQLNMTFGSTDCVKDISQRFSDFFTGQKNAADIHANWTCVTGVVGDFVRLSKGEQFQKDDLRLFLTDHFFQSGLSDQAVATTMQLKQIIVGGASDSISKSEVAVLLEKISELDSITATLAPHMRVLFGDANATASQQEWDQSFQVFASQLPKLAALLANGNQSYLFSDAQAFIQAWADQLKVSDDSPLRKIASAMPLIAKAKWILVAGATDRIRATEWSPLLQQLQTAYVTYRSASRLMDLHSDDVSLVLREPGLQDLVKNLIVVLRTSVQAQSRQQIKLSDLNDLFAQLEAGGYFPQSITAEQAGAALQFLVTKIFTGENAAGNVIDLAHINDMQKFIDRWQTLKTAYESGRMSAVPEFTQAIQADNWRLGLDATGRLQIPPTDSPALQNEYVPIFTVIEWLGQKWGPGVWPLSRDTFHAVVTDVLTLFHDFHWLPNTNDGIYLRLLREANLFMPSSNGDMLLGSSEAFQYALYALSSYRSSHQLRKLAQGKCDAADFACYQSVLYTNRQTLLSNVPLLNTWLGADESRFQDFTTNLNVISGTTYLTEFMVINYIETFMQRFDRNHDGLINLSEAMGAYPIYGPVLTEILSKYGIGANEIQALYTFLFNYGATPFSMFGGSVRYLYWKWNPSSWSFSADRKTLAGILAELAKL